MIISILSCGLAVDGGRRWRLVRDRSIAAPPRELE
jgi:hypothetical protein